ncbi:MAG TPA: hypothetical protein VLC06_28330 [Polyangia bacterium]|jgi:hypothetical protein|nr:hypothetical protein [Polyangia bacterium]
MTLSKQAFALVVFCALCLCSLRGWAASLERPGVGGIETIGELPGWWRAGSNPAGYLVGIDRAVRHRGQASARLKSNGESPTGFGSLMQMSSADEYRGRRVRMSAWVRSEKVVGPSGLWMRVDGPGGDATKPLAVDTMQGRGIVGTRDWQRYEIVLDVPTESVDIAYGAHLSGGGTLWIDDVQFEGVNDGVAVTAPTVASAPRAKNLDFENVRLPPEDGLRGVQRSQIEAHVPPRVDFNGILTRDLSSYFSAARTQKAVAVDFEMLRDGPTQVGVSYPKFYVWVRVAGGKSADDRGAVRLAAVERKRFVVTDFVSERVIRRDREDIRRVFPAAVCEKIHSMLGKGTQ